MNNILPCLRTADVHSEQMLKRKSTLNGHFNRYTFYIWIPLRFCFHSVQQIIHLINIDIASPAAADIVFLSSQSLLDWDLISAEGSCPAGNSNERWVVYGYVNGHQQYSSSLWHFTTWQFVQHGWKCANDIFNIITPPSLAWNVYGFRGFCQILTLPSACWSRSWDS